MVFHCLAKDSFRKSGDPWECKAQLCLSVPRIRALCATDEWPKQCRALFWSEVSAHEPLSARPPAKDSFWKSGDPWENRTPVCGVRGRRLDRLTNGP